MQIYSQEKQEKTFFLKIFFRLYECFPKRMSMYHKQAWGQSRSESLDPLELDLKRVVKCHLNSGDQTQVGSWKNSQCF